MWTWTDPFAVGGAYNTFNSKFCFEARDLLHNCLDKTSMDIIGAYFA